MKNNMRKVLAMLCLAALVFAMTARGSAEQTAETAAAATDTPAETTAEAESTSETETAKSFKVGICNYVDDASLNQIVENIRAQFDKAAEENGISIEVLYDNCNADAAVMEQIISNFIA